MRTSSSILIALVALIGFLPNANASSSPPQPLKRIAHPSTQNLHILPRNPHSTRSSRRSRTSDEPGLQYSDSFRLTLRAFDETFNLHLRPSNLFHPSARINYYNSEGDIRHSEPLLAESFRIYEGAVVAPELSDERLKEDLVGGVAWPRREELGWAKIIVHDDGEVSGQPSYEGAFTANGVTYHIKTQENYLRNKLEAEPDVDYDDLSNGHLVIYRDSDRSLQPGSLLGSCSHDALDYNTDQRRNPVLAYEASLLDPPAPWYDPRAAQDDPMELGARMHKRQGDIGGGNITSNFINSIGSHSGCPATGSALYMGVAADCEYVTHYGSTQNATSQILNNWNTVSALYKSTFNVSLGIVELAVQDPTCPTVTNSSVPWNLNCSNSATLNDRLNLFSQWRGAKGGGDGAGLWHLMSGCPTGTEIGVAWLGVLCQVTAQQGPGEVVSGAAVSTASSTEWQVVAHETGHNFGAIHDCTDGCTLTSPCCPETTSVCSSPQNYIMDPVSYAGENTFSQCTVGNICTSMQTLNTSCLLPASDAVKTISLEMCGNGIVEAGEQCDPGKGVTSPCCDSATCQFTNGAQCDPKSSDCCTDQCTFAPSTQVCRPSINAICDIAESCTGTSANCPPDKTTKDGTSCGSNGLACASGHCTSISQQCATVGSSMNLTKACPQAGDTSCQVACADPTDSNTCIVLQATLIDGSPCGYGGSCESGNCKPGSLGDKITSWYRQNLQIAIPVTIAVALIVLLILWRLFTGILGCCRRRSRVQAQAVAYKTTVPRQQLQDWDAANAGYTGYPPPRDPPPTNLRGYVSPGVQYPPSYNDESTTEVGSTTLDRGRSQVSHGSSDPNPFADPNAPRGQSPERQAAWVDDRAYNGAGYRS